MTGDWLPDEAVPLEPLDELPPDLRSLLMAANGPTRLVLHGPPGAASRALAVRVARLAQQWFTVRWVSVARAHTAPEFVLLRLLESLPGTQHLDVLRGLPLADPDLLADALTLPCRKELTQRRFLVVLDGVPEGPCGDDLLRLATGLVDGTSSRVLVVRYEHTAGEDPRPTAVSQRAEDLLETLEQWRGDEVNVSVAAALNAFSSVPRTHFLEAFHELRASGLLQQTRLGWYRPHGHAPSGVAWSLDEVLANGLLDRTAGPEGAADAYVDLAGRLLCVAWPRATELLALLEPHFTGRVGLFRLLRLKQSLWRATGDWEPVRLIAAIVARDTGHPVPAIEALASVPTPRAALETAVAQRCAGLLAEATTTLDAIPGDVPNGWVLHTRAAVQCDRGELAGADRLLRSAVEAHQVRGDRRGEAWAIHHYGRLRLIRGDLEEAQKRLETARHLFADLGDQQGQAWTETELGKVHLLYGSHEDAAQRLKTALGLHSSNLDPRGKAWTSLWLALIPGESGAPLFGDSTARDAERIFRDVPDHLGLAWARHYRALLAHPARGRQTTVGARSRLLLSMAGFRQTDCPHGFAWSHLEMSDLQQWDERTGHTGRTGRTAPALAHPDPGRLFTLIDDPSGPHWLAIRPLGSPDPIPLTARLTIPEPGTRFRTGALSPATHSRIRVLLLDDRSTTGTASRIALCVEPGPEHPWADPAGPAAGLPWLTVRATPLTPADVEPAHAMTLRPSARATDAAEFLFTPRRAGRHRLLFTVEHHDTATVLQEVETYIDVVEGDGGAPRSDTAPEAARRA
ncbi:hypothetical protein [Streptomyces sp. G45]|uniref:hypothetical protein n=1 Tax=Streptomyces sp. G45 TaxID=3406627 RepID=UPI003C190CE1